MLREFGENWRNRVMHDEGVQQKTVRPSRHQQTPTSPNRHQQTPASPSWWNFPASYTRAVTTNLGRVTIAVCDVPGDGNCLFYSLGSIVHPTISARQARAEVIDFYLLAEDVTLAALEEIHQQPVEDLRQRPAEIRHRGTWGEAVDITAFVSMHQVSIRVVYLNPDERIDSTIITIYPVNENGEEDRTAPLLEPLLVHTGVNHFCFGYFL